MVKKNFCISGKEWTPEGIKDNSSAKMCEALHNLEKSINDNCLYLFRTILEKMDLDDDELIQGELISTELNTYIRQLRALRELMDSVDSIIGDLSEYILLDNGSLKYEDKEEE